MQTERAGANRITWGLPSLTPRKRSSRDVVSRTRQHADDALAEQRSNDAFTVAPDGGIDTTDLVAQMGRPLTSSDVILRLKKANTHLLFERSLADPTKYGIYVVENRDGQTSKRFVVGMESGYMPEFSVRHFTEKQVPDPTVVNHWRTEKTFTRETRGWRTVLVRLLRDKLISQAQIDRYFDPSGGRSSANWQGLTT